MKKQILISLILLSLAWITNAQIYDTGDKVGIGTTNPLVKLNVYSGTYALPATSGIVQPGATLRLHGADNGILDFGESNDGLGTFWIQATDITSLDQKYKLLLNPNGGNIGIGAIAPESKLTINGNFKIGNSLDNSSQWIGKATSGTEIFRNAIKFVSTNDEDYIQFNTHKSGISSDIRMTINGIGNVGIGTPDPLVKLNVYSGSYGLPATTGSSQLGAILRLRGGDSGILDFGESNDGLGTFWIQATDIVSLAQNYKLLINPNGGNVLIGKTSQANNTYKLDVNGTIRANEIKVNLDGADFVFEKDYKLMPLKELEKFIKEQKHLPEIAPAKEMEKNGTELGDLNSKLLQKMEEMTLYMIEQNKMIESLEKTVKAQNEEIEKLIATSK